MRRDTWKDGECYKCGEKYRGFISDEDPYRNVCAKCVDPSVAVENARSVRYFACQPYYDTGLGCYVNSRGERAAIMKQRDLVCMGDDYKYLDDVPLGEKGEKSAVTDNEWGQIWHDEVESKQ